MKLNRNNYEEFFILYLDNELDSETRREVEAFAQQNPDLKAELDMLLQSKLTPDADINFADKGSLMRFDNASISLANYEEWLTSYIDDELTEGERKDVEIFVAGNPAIQRELNLLQQTKLQPEAIVFPYKESLYRKEEKAKVITIRWWRIAAAAVLLLAISTTAVVLINNKKGNKIDDVAKAPDKVKEPTNNPVIKQQLANESTNNEQQVAVSDQKKEEPVIKITPNEVVKRNSNKEEEKKKELIQVKDDKPVIAKINEEKKSTNDLATPENNPNVNPKANDAIASVEGSNPPLTNDKPNLGITNVTSHPSDTYINTSGSENKDKNSDVTYASEKSGNKGIRGFLRKVTRTFEKRTNIKATDDEDRLLIAGLAIKLN